MNDCSNLTKSVIDKVSKILELWIASMKFLTEENAWNISFFTSNLIIISQLVWIIRVNNCEKDKITLDNWIQRTEAF